VIDAGLILRGRFKVLKHLGAGGMGEVYLGDDLEQNQKVAIKRMLIEQDNVDKELFDRRFREEVNILRRLNCPGIPAFVDAFSEDGHSFLVMEFIEGYSLDKLLQVSQLENQGLSAEQVATVALHISQVLEYLHSQTPPLVHRDIKPSNMIIREVDQRIFLVDFGLAREIQSTSSAKTQIGTWSYAPIEQIRGQVEPRSDFYSLGVTMLELLSGQLPAALAIPPARQVMPDLCESLAQIIDRCTKSEVTLRYPEACLLSQDLEAALNGMAQPSAESTAEPVSREEAIAQMVRCWGQGRSRPPAPPPPPDTPPEVPLGASPEVKKAVDRARRRLLYERFATGPVRLLFLLFLLVSAMATWSVYQSNAQAEQLAPLSPGPQWKFQQARGVGPKGVLQDGGVLFVRSKGAPIRELRFQLQGATGSLDLLVFAGRYGIHLVPAGKGYEAMTVQLGRPRSLEMPTLRGLGSKTVVAGSFAMSLVSRQGHLILAADGREVSRCKVEEDWRGGLGGLLQRTESAQAQSQIRSLTIR
jgi:serine/threonine protein kinase